MRFGRRIPFVLGLVMATACSETAEPEPKPEPEPLPSCQVNNTADVYFKNLSNTNSTYGIVWNGSKIATVPPRRFHREVHVRSRDPTHATLQVHEYQQSGVQPGDPHSHPVPGPLALLHRLVRTG